jgi:ANTAR domain
VPEPPRTVDAATRPPTGEPPPDATSSAILEALRDLVPSARPSVVLTSLAVAAVPAFADECTITVTKPAVRCLVAWPRRAGGEDPSGRELSVPFEQEARGTEPVYAATVTYRWLHRPPVPAAAAVGRLLVDRAGDLVRTERLAEALAAANAKAEQMETALHSNREIGQALGILMYSRKLTSQQAFDLMRTTSQHTNRKMRDIAAEISRTGTLPGGVSSRCPGSASVRAG